MELTNWKTVYKQESWGSKTYGIEIRVAIDRPLNENDEKAMYSIAADIESAVLGESMKLDPEVQRARTEEREKILALFGDRAIHVEEAPNGYCSRWCCTQKPWFIVTTYKGRVTVGWRKRVISIEWGRDVNGTAEALFPGEDVTKMDRLIHAYGYGKAQEYINRLFQL